MRVFRRPRGGIVSPRNGPIKPCPIPRFNACMIVVPTTGGKEMNEVKEDVEARKAFYIHPTGWIERAACPPIYRFFASARN